MTTIRDQAEALASEFRALGRDVEIAHSTNRDGGHSSYLTVSGLAKRLRISDHHSGWTDAVDAFGSAADIIAAAEKAGQIRRDEERADRAALTERDAPFRARYFAAKDHERHAIVCEAYPAAVTNKTFRRDIIARWTLEG
ncbi:hypothetical protein [Sphingomonas fennica]|nr:hypothetical protein [Sphingomonas fennica]